MSYYFKKSSENSRLISQNVKPIEIQRLPEYKNLGLRETFLKNLCNNVYKKAFMIHDGVSEPLHDSHETNFS